MFFGKITLVSSTVLCAMLALECHICVYCVWDASTRWTKGSGLKTIAEASTYQCILVCALLLNVFSRWHKMGRVRWRMLMVSAILVKFWVLVVAVWLTARYRSACFASFVNIRLCALPMHCHLNWRVSYSAQMLITTCCMQITETWPMSSDARHELCRNYVSGSAE